jgi:hypothetical protein
MRDSVERDRSLTFLLLLVLDRWVRDLEGSVYLVRLWGPVPTLLDDNCIDCGFGESNRGDRGFIVLVPVHICVDIVS